MDFDLERDRMLDYSYWHPKITKCPIRMPKSVVVKIDPDNLSNLCNHFCMEHPKEDLRAIEKWVDEDILPKLDEAKLFGLLFVKNGRFSHKFDAKNCLCMRENLATAIANINYHAMMFDAGGLGEVVIEQRIQADYTKVPTIYNGLPYRPEFRVFYDFDTHEHLYTVNYWDYDYVYPHLYDMTDKLVFNTMRIQMDKAFEENKERVSLVVREALKQAEGLTGKWSVDILLDEKDHLWLIDMAIAERSAYWERHEEYVKKKAAGATSKLLIKPINPPKLDISQDLFYPEEAQKIEQPKLKEVGAEQPVVIDITKT